MTPSGPRPAPPARPEERPDHLIADKGHAYERPRKLLRRRGIACAIPERDDQLAWRARKLGPKAAFDKGTYRRCNVVEGCVNRLKQWRGIATRFEKRAATYWVVTAIAVLMIWLGQ